jgi:hypothetical protein
VSLPIGEVRVDVRGDTSNVEKDIDRGLDKVGKDLDSDFQDLGHRWGKETSKGIGNELEKSGPSFSRALENAASTIKEANLPWTLDRDRNTIRRGVAKLADEIESEVRSLSSGSGGGPFGVIGATIKDAIGAGFNISGKSPLIVALIPLVGAIVELVIGAIQAINALTTALFIIPGALGAIVLQVGTLFIAFQGLGTAIQGAFAAKNANELKKAIEGLTPSTQEFVKSLLPLKDFFKTLHAIVQENFFYNFGNSISAVAKTLGPILTQNLGNLAAALGGFARGVVTFFADPAFLYFIRLIIPATVRWLDSFGPALNKFLFGLTQIGIYLTPFFEWVGSSLTSSLATLGDWLNRLSSDPEFLQWLEDMKVTFGLLGKVIDSVAFFVFALVRAVDRAGGNKILEDIADQIGTIAAYLSTDLGTKAIEGLIHLVVALTYFFTFLVLGVLALLTAFELVLEFLRHGVAPWLADFFSNKVPEFFEMVGSAILDFFTMVGHGLIVALEAIGKFFVDLGAALIRGLFDWGGAIVTGIADWLASIGHFIGSLWDKFTSFVANLGDLLWHAGLNAMDRLIQGILAKLGPLGNALSFVAQRVKDHFNSSPAKEGPLAGSGDPIYSGQEFVKRYITGLEMETPALESAVNSVASTVVFGPNSVQANFNGALPTSSQAMGLGMSLGQGITARIATRDTRLAVRAMA